SAIHYGIRWVNGMSSQTRKYALKVRAEKQAETRRRIVEATAALHTEVGPARTTVAEIARRAGVQRLTVYNNFPEERELFEACGAYWLAGNPPPDPTAALEMKNPTERLSAALVPLYSWHPSTARTIEKIERDPRVMDPSAAKTNARSLRTVSQMCHAFAEPGGHGRTQKDTTAVEVEYRRTLAEPAGHGRTRDT